ncbi:MAG: hypothetical protein U5L96_05390 [Owenweeksia sp.]|nr:hypothetical protein [Owenweeksia sp.]
MHVIRHADIDSLYVNNSFVRPSTSVVEKKKLNINSFGRVVTSLSVHPNDKGRVIATLGNYGNQSYVYLNANADAVNPGPFLPVQGNLPAMPVYSSTFNFTGSPNQVLVGTEYGVYVTEDVEASSVDWVQEVNNFATIPIYTLEQDLTVRYDLKGEDDFEGSIYAGTYGRGIWKTSTTANFVTIGNEEHELEEESSAKGVLNIYPNPAADKVSIEVDIDKRTDIEIVVRNLNGKMVKQVRYEQLPRNT